MITVRRRNYYRNYHGRRSKGKAALALLLILVIVAAVIVILMQRNVVYDETGAPRLDVPWKEEAGEQQETPELDLVIQEPAKEVDEVRCFRLAADQMTLAGVEAALAAHADCNAVALPLRDASGKVLFRSETAVNGSTSFTEETMAVLEQLVSDETYYTIAQFGGFHDPKAANADVDGMGLKNTGGFIFYDGNNSQWLDPAKSAARQYLCDLAVDAAELGIDEILLTDFGYPTNGKLDKINYGEAGKNENLLAFLQEMRAALEPYGVGLSVQLPAVVVTEGREEASGLVLSEIVPVVDRVYAPALPDEAEAMAETIRGIREDVVFVPVLVEATAETNGNFLLN